MSFPDDEGLLSPDQQEQEQDDSYPESDEDSGAAWSAISSADYLYEEED